MFDATTLTTTIKDFGVCSVMHDAIKQNKLDDIKQFLKEGTLVNDPVSKTGPLAGYTALHVACIENNEDVVRFLVKDYHADVNVVAEDGIQPIHLASFNCLRSDIIKTLLASNADADAEFGQDIYSKYVEGGDWCSDFGDKMSILTHAVLHNNFELARVLIENNANRKIKSLTNKTLIMHALAKNYFWMARTIAHGINDPEFINARDDDGVPTTHYLLHPKSYGSFRYDSNQIFDSLLIGRGMVLRLLINEGADIHALINDDPDTLLFHMASYRSCESILDTLLHHHTSLAHSKALYYATLPIKDPQSCLRMPLNEPQNKDLWSQVERKRKRCTQLILRDLVQRRTFGLDASKEEINLMDKLIACNEDIRNIVHKNETNFTFY